MKNLSIMEIRSKRRGALRDFAISGRPLLPGFERQGFDLVPRIGNGLVPIDIETQSLLLCERSGDTPSGRVALYICPLCGDYGCGVISAKIEKDAGSIVWSEFGYENDYYGEFHPIERLGPFRFAFEDYQSVVGGRN